MILVCGEALIDLFVDAPERGGMPARAVPGGSPFNVAIGLARLGIETGFLGGISRDAFGSLSRLRARRGSVRGAVVAPGCGWWSRSFGRSSDSDRSRTCGSAARFRGRFPTNRASPARQIRPRNR
ncbi:hypothetical protein FQV39_22505 [Bosea sp. F3-2]|nr:hypothetical protein FQV39_22505 [Bosea sp. F3-2]